MRLPCALPILMLAACGGDRTIVDFFPDANGDDGAMPPAATVWTVGEVFTEGELVAVSTDGVRIPATGGLYATGTSPSPHVFSASATHVAYVAADGSVHLARADGSELRSVVGAEANLETPALALSPGGAQLAFLRDALGRDNQYDVRVWRDGATIDVTPARSTPAPALQPGELLTWSAEGRYLGFTGDFTEDGYEQAYVVDTHASTPAPVALVERAEIAAGSGLGTRGVVGALQFDRADRIYFRGRIETGSQFRLYRAAVSGVASRTVVPMPARSNGTPPDVGSFALVGDRLVVAADAPTATVYDLHVVGLDTHAATRVTAVTSAGRPSLVQPMWLSPDGNTVALVGDYLTAGSPSVRNEPYVVALDGSTPQPRRLVQVGAECGSCDASTLQWSPDSRIMYALGDLLVENETETYLLDAATTEQAPPIVRDFADMRDAIGLTVR